MADTRETPDHLTVYRTSGTRAKIVLLLWVIPILAFAWFGVRLQLGSQLSEIVAVRDPQAPDFAEKAIRFAPSNPQGYWLKGAVIRGSFEAADLNSVAAWFSEAARRGPFHYRWWTELGRANEHIGNMEGAESAYLRAVELAPEYTLPRWQLANFYLRQGRRERVAEHLRVAARYSPLYRGQVFATTWNFFGNDPGVLETFVDERPASRSGLALFYASQNRPDEALRNWNFLTDEQKQHLKADAETAMKTLLALHSYRGAVEFAKQAGIDPAALPEAITNGDFESAIKDRNGRTFDWFPFKREPKIENILDTHVKHSGQRSFRTTFRAYDAPSLESVSQVVAVAPGGRYRVTSFYRTEDLRSGGMPRVEIIDPRDGRGIAASQAFATGTNDWQRSIFEFAIPDDIDGVIVRIGREPCSSAECPIVGTLWIDDLQLARL